MALAFGALAQAQNKVGVISIQNAIVSTKDGQKAAGELETRSAPKRKVLESKQSEINSLKDQLQKGTSVLSESAKQNLYRDIDSKTKSLNRDMEDAEAEFQQDQQKVLQELGQRMMAIIDKYAKENGYNLILDVSSPQTPVLYASNAIDITKEIIDLYDKNGGAPAVGQSNVPSGAAVAKPAAPKTPAPAVKKP
jgi:outer membrane protein